MEGWWTLKCVDGDSIRRRLMERRGITGNSDSGNELNNE